MQYIKVYVTRMCEHDYVHAVILLPGQIMATSYIATKRMYAYSMKI